MFEYNLDHKDLDTDKLDVEALNLVPEEFAVKNKVLPIKVIDDTLHIAMRCNEDAELLARLKLITNMKLYIIKIAEDKLVEMIPRAYGYLKFNKAVSRLKKDTEGEEKKNTPKIMGKDDESAPAVVILDYIINNAIIVRASDIHLEPQEGNLMVRYRVDGSLMEFLNLPVEVYSAVSTRLKVLCSMDISEKRIPQDGKYHYFYGERELDLRISSIPVLFGEKFVIRILDKTIDYCNIESIYEDLDQSKLIKRLLMHNSGIILVTGPTGSGKSTTLYAMLKELNRKSINITSIEDPVEYTMKGINQISVNVKAGITFAVGLRSILRQDPDVIMIGEIRDEETAAIAIRAAITGHLVLSTLHTNDAIGAVNRLVEMGVERYLLADALIAVIAQRLVRRICSHCKESYRPDQIEMSMFADQKVTTLYKGRGCQACNHSGYFSRTVLSEILIIEEDVRRQILKGEACSKSKGTISGTNLTAQCKALVLKGLTTTEELIRVSNGKIFS
ncbi:GspE/PulE family protein [Clostridium thermarum]|uniref:GspE/PulE family protein n=1 Tax=Clostridium thermarum TaxID=1716543 RepID=UPI00111FFCED|nr:GspE/PulE family protein [Clostridium thermarum]